MNFLVKFLFSISDSWTKIRISSLEVVVHLGIVIGNVLYLAVLAAITGFGLYQLGRFLLEKAFPEKFCVSEPQPSGKNEQEEAEESEVETKNDREEDCKEEMNTQTYCDQKTTDSLMIQTSLPEAEVQKEFFNLSTQTEETGKSCAESQTAVEQPTPKLSTSSTTQTDVEKVEQHKEFSSFITQTEEPLKSHTEAQTDKELQKSLISTMTQTETEEVSPTVPERKETPEEKSRSDAAKVAAFLEKSPIANSLYADTGPSISCKIHCEEYDLYVLYATDCPHLNDIIIFVFNNVNRLREKVIFNAEQFHYEMIQCPCQYDASKNLPEDATPKLVEKQSDNYQQRMRISRSVDGFLEKQVVVKVVYPEMRMGMRFHMKWAAVRKEEHVVVGVTVEEKEPEPEPEESDEEEEYSEKEFSDEEYEDEEEEEEEKENEKKASLPEPDFNLDMLHHLGDVSNDEYDSDPDSEFAPAEDSEDGNEENEKVMQLPGTADPENPGFFNISLN